MRLTRPGLLLRLEGAVVFALAFWLYARTGAPWLLFVALLLVPDLSMPGYLAGNRVGAAVYNAAHTYLLPAVLAAAGVAADNPRAVAVALVWVAHIGADRVLGYGLKYPAAFKDTHLQRL